MKHSTAWALFVGVVVAIAWGAFAFAAVYPWAYLPLALVCATVGIGGLSLGVAGRPPIAWVALGFALVAVGISFQLVPLPRPLLVTLSPGTDAFLRQQDFGYLFNPSTWRPISIAPQQTLVGLMLFVALALFCLGVARIASSVGAQVLVTAIAVIGVVLVLVGVAQLAAYPAPTPNDPTFIYGVWRPQYFSFPFGPFINRNHFAGWMLMASPLVLGIFFDALFHTLDEAAARGRSLALLNSPNVGILITTGTTTIVMAASIALTRSRAGIVAFAVMSLPLVWVVFRRQLTLGRRLTIVACFSALVLGSALWIGFGTVTEKFTSDEQATSSLGGRVPIWRDTLHIASDFRLTGSGLDTYGTAMIAYQTVATNVHFMEAHNDYLQLAAEGGTLLVVPTIFLLGAFAVSVAQRFREAPKSGRTYWIRVGAIVGMIAIAAQTVFEFSLQMPGNAALFAVLCGIALHRSPRLQVGHAHRRGERHGHAVS
ncbi:MAG: O-antigen ligase family protein [Acidobacteriaceae bacterium]|jgi:O-antigen ligase|nr:O-antigen ligase family protein [Acidobacteriaceae bacterium]